MNPVTIPGNRHVSAFELTGRHVLIATSVFFGIVFAVNGVLLWKAVATHSGLVAQEPYRKGLHYNQRIDAGERQLESGWSDTITVDTSSAITLKLTDKFGRPVSGLELTAVLGRPATVRHDMKLQLMEQAPGHYVAPLIGIESGAWLLTAEARSGAIRTSDPREATVYRVKRRLWLKP